MTATTAPAAAARNCGLLRKLISLKFTRCCAFAATGPYNASIAMWVNTDQYKINMTLL